MDLTLLKTLIEDALRLLTVLVGQDKESASVVIKPVF
jgi:hypothetical protein